VHILLVFDSKVTAYPADIAHCRVYSFHVKLILQANWKPVQWAYHFTCLSIMFIQLLGAVNRLVEENLVKTVVLSASFMLEKVFLRPVFAGQAYDLVGNGSRLAERDRDAQCGEFARFNGINNSQTIQ
jgi:hypothetical protein